MPPPLDPKQGQAGFCDPSPDSYWSRDRTGKPVPNFPDRALTADSSMKLMGKSGAREAKFFREETCGFWRLRHLSA